MDKVNWQDKQFKMWRKKSVLSLDKGTTIGDLNVYMKEITLEVDEAS